jgi:hypothetical protein
MNEPLVISAVLREVARLNAVHNAPASLVTLRRNCRAEHPRIVDNSVEACVERGLLLPDDSVGWWITTEGGDILQKEMS